MSDSREMLKKISRIYRRNCTFKCKPRPHGALRAIAQYGVWKSRQAVSDTCQELTQEAYYG